MFFLVKIPTMKHWYLLILCLLFSVIYVSAKPRRDGKLRKFPRMGVVEITTCKGQTVNLNKQIDSSVQQCLDNRTRDIEEQFVTRNANGKNGGAKRMEKTKARLTKKMKRKCTTECEWKAFDLIPDVNGTANYPSVQIPNEFLKAFPNEVQGTLKTKMETCYNITSPLLPKEGKKGSVFKRNMCFTNMKLMKCLGRTVRQTCNGKVKSSPEGGKGVVSESKDIASSTPTSQISKNDIEDDDDDDDDDDLNDEKDDDDNDGENGDTTVGVTYTTKEPPPSTHIDMSKPITK